MGSKRVTDVVTEGRRKVDQTEKLWRLATGLQREVDAWLAGERPRGDDQRGRSATASTTSSAARATSMSSGAEATTLTPGTFDFSSELDQELGEYERV